MLVYFETADSLLLITQNVLTNIILKKLPDSDSLNLRRAVTRLSY